MRNDRRPHALRNKQALLVPIPRVVDVTERECLEDRDGRIGSALLDELASDGSDEWGEVLAVCRVNRAGDEHEDDEVGGGRVEVEGAAVDEGEGRGDV
jgi:hypothetical protein